jgi:hypothetical protein
MKYQNRFFAAALTAAFTFSSCDQKAADPASPGAPGVSPAEAAAAIDRKLDFTRALESFADKMEQRGKEQQVSPMERMKSLPGILGKLEQIPTDGLPEDLVAAFSRITKANVAMSALIAAIPAELPSDPELMQAYLLANPEAMKTMEELQTKMILLKAESNLALKDLEAAAAEHGLDVHKFIKAGKAVGGG